MQARLGAGDSVRPAVSVRCSGPRLQKLSRCESMPPGWDVQSTRQFLYNNFDLNLLIIINLENVF